MVDFHTHVLHQIDDGSSSIEESVRMLEESFLQGVGKLVVTPHFYPWDEYPDDFFRRRELRKSELEEAIIGRTNIPQLFWGAEVHYFHGISRAESLENFTVGGTNLLMVEMPVEKWTTHMIEEILVLQEQCQLQVILAHIDRYFFQKKAVKEFEMLQGRGVILQISAQAIYDSRVARQAFKLMGDNPTIILGSDCHNLTSRPPNMQRAKEKILGRFGENYFDELQQFSHSLLC